MSGPNIFDEIGNAIGGAFNSIDQAIGSGATGLTRGFQPEPQAAPRPVAAKRKPATIASMKPAQAKESASASLKVNGVQRPAKNPHKVGEWYMEGGIFKVRLPSLNPFVKSKNDQIAAPSNPKPKHRATAHTADPKPKSRIAARKPGRLGPET